MPEYCSPGYKVHDGPQETSPREPQNKLEILEAAGNKPNLRDGAVRRAGSRKQEHPAIKY